MSTFRVPAPAIYHEQQTEGKDQRDVRGRRLEPISSLKEERHSNTHNEKGHTCVFDDLIPEPVPGKIYVISPLDPRRKDPRQQSPKQRRQDCRRNDRNNDRPRLALHHRFGLRTTDGACSHPIAGLIHLVHPEAFGDPHVRCC
ncbi:MAG TPA: hypothetical protein VFG91_05045 [Woeseiaceae bacterium]|nr:hypothetical protein [Woeseiaceae bacterium]